MTIIMRHIRIILKVLFLYSTITFGQCNYQITHLTGTESVNGISVTVESFGKAMSYSFCDVSPYMIGGGYPNGMFEVGDGGYTFSFSPAISSASLNFSAIDNIPSWQAEEEIEILINGTHYNPSQSGLHLNECNSAMAVLKENGNIGGNPSVMTGSGFNNLSISGNIQTLTVFSHLIMGNPGGSLFSLSICNNNLQNDDFEMPISYNLFSNPMNDYFTFTSTKELNNVSMKVLNIQGQTCQELKAINGTQVYIERSSLAKGVYFIQVKEKDEIIFNSKIIN